MVSKYPLPSTPSNESIETGLDGIKRLPGLDGGTVSAVLDDLGEVEEPTVVLYFSPESSVSLLEAA